MKQSSDMISVGTLSARRTASIVAAIITMALPARSNAQASTSESIQELQSGYDTVVSNYISQVQDLPDNPDLFNSLAAIAQSLETGDLQKLSRELGEAKKLISEREAEIEKSGLSVNDKNELKAALVAQGKPLDLLTAKVEEFGKSLVELRSAKLKSWKEVYDTFLSVSGSDKARTRLRVLVNEFCKPYAQQPAKSAETAKVASAKRPSSSAPSLSQPISPSDNYADGRTDQVDLGPVYRNSLGQKFVPIPGTRAYFCVWDARVSDYARFIQETGRAWKPAGFPQKPDHPAVRVGYYDAVAFCEWLTARERTTGKLPGNLEYRLPKDLEWSAAVGMSGEMQGLPSWRSGGVPSCYSWGSSWPPPRGAGNYDPRLKADSFPFTSPVGSFSPNKFGLYDMSGNVYQWIKEDFDDNGQGCLRGGSWPDEEQESLNLSIRFPSEKTSEIKCFGFRCVIALIEE